MKKSDAARKLYYLVRNAQSHSSDPLKNMLVLLDDIEKEIGMNPPEVKVDNPEDYLYTRFWEDEELGS